MEWKNLIGKQIFVKLKDGSCYNGKIDSISETINSYKFITIIDKYKKLVTFSESEIIKLIEEDK